MRRHFVTIIGLFFILLAQSLRAASSCPLDSVLTFNIDSLLTEVTIYDYVVDTPRTTVWTVDPTTGIRTGKSREESYSSNLKTMTAKYEWDNSSHSWRGTEKEEKVFKYFSGVKKEISTTTFVWLNAKWVADTRITSNFDASAREIEYYEYSRNTTTNQLQPTLGHVYTWIDDTQKSLEIQYTAYGTNAWLTGTKQEWAFDDEGRQTLAASSTLTNGNWIGNAKETWEYAGQEGQQTLHETYEWYNNNWSMTLREIAAFDEAGNQTLIENYTGANGVPTGVQKEEYAFDGENTTLTVIYTWSTSKKDWIGKSHETWTYGGPSGEKTYYEKQVWRSGAWGDSIQETWEYNGPDGKQTYRIRYTWNTAAATMLKSLEYIDEYDSNNHPINREYYTYTNGVQKGTSHYTYTYVNNLKMEYDVYAWKDGAWTDSIKQTWEYNGPSSKQTKHEKSIWENGAWTLLLQENTGYTGTTLTSIENYELIEGVWTGTKREEYTYTSGKKTLELIYAWDNGWVNGTKEAWTYDAKKRETLHEKSQWENGAWVGIEKKESAYLGTTTTKTQELIYQWQDNTWTNQSKEDWAYDAANQLTAHEKNEWINGAWVGVEKQEYAFDGSTKTLELIYQWYNNAWIYQTREAWAYESGRQTLHEKQGWNGLNWVDMQREIAGYDAAGNQTLVENYALYTTTGWTGLKKEEYAFEGGKKTVTIKYAWSTDHWIESTKNEIGYQDGNTEVSEANYIWSGETWVGSGNLTYTTTDSEDRVVELITKNWPDGASEWTNASITTHEFNAAGDEILTYNGTWNGTRWAVSSMERLDKIIDNQGRLLMKASWECGSDSIWKGVEKDTTNYSASGKVLFTAHYKGWKNNDWIPVSKAQNTYDASDRPLIEESYNWSNNKWQGIFRYESAYDEQGRRTSYTTYSWDASKNAWRGSSKQESVFYKNYKDKYVSITTYDWNENKWDPLFLNTYTYDSSDREIEQIVQTYSNGVWKNSNKYVKEYSGTKLVTEETYAWSNNQWAIRSRNKKYYDEDTQAKLRREIIATWNFKGLKSYEDKHYNYACDLRTIRFVNYDGALLEEQKIEKGVTPVYSGETPTRPDDGATYNFIGWTPEIATVTGDATYTATFSSTVNQYTVTFKDEDGTILSNELWDYNATPSCTEPSKDPDAQYTYTFAGWTPAIEHVTGEATYVATYSSTTNQYTITFKDEDGSTLDSRLWDYNATPTCTEPSKDATAEYTYTFAGWSPTVIAVNGEATYTATYTQSTRQYTITFKNDDGTILSSQLLDFGTTPTCTEPTKDPDAQYTYSFAGWTPAIANVTGEATYVATYSSTTNQYTITFKDEDGSTLDSRLWDYNATPTCTEPTKDPDAQYTFSFAGWSPAIANVTGEATYVATYSSTTNQYTITFKDEDGSTLDSRLWDYNATPTCTEPSKDATAEYTYTFAGWSPAVAAVTGNATYTATYAATKNSYTITWLDDEGTEIDHTTVEFGLTPAHANINIEKESTAEYTYSFTGWNPAIVPVTGDATYQATFTASKRSYLITFYYENGTTILDQVMVEYGATPATSLIPSSPSDAHYSYTFAGWAPEVVPVTGEASYVATYTAIPNKYTITFKNYNGRVLERTKVEYGAPPEYEGETPFRPATASCVYEFTGWSPEIAEVIGDATYTAVFEAIINTYTIIFYDEDGITELDRTIVEHGQKPTTDVVPTKPEDEEFTYTFAGWNPKVVKATADASYVATYTAKSKTTPEGVSNVDAASEQVTKVIIDGQIFILRGAHIYSIDGVLVR